LNVALTSVQSFVPLVIASVSTLDRWMLYSAPSAESDFERFSVLTHPTRVYSLLSSMLTSVYQVPSSPS